jgi:CTP:molybdopterin cytidylyltransferase MocA
MTDAADDRRPVAGLVLAAGEGRRFGGPKALVTLDGSTLVDRAVGTLHAAGCAPVLVVLGAAARDVVATADLDRAVVVVNDGWAEGMGSSLRCGLAALADQGAPATVVLLVDQPEVPPELVRRLAGHWRPGVRAVVASYDGQARNPVLLDASIWAEVCATARGDVGARAWLRAHADDIRQVACDDLGSAADIDTPADLTQLLEDRP